jgi:hypothetical protein
MLVLSEATPADAALLTRLVREGKAYWGYPAEWLKLWKDELTITPEQIAAWHIRTAAAEGKLVGFFALAPRQGEWWLEHLWLVVGQIGRGLGRELFHRAVAAAAGLGASRLWIEADPNAEGFYLHMGASRDGERVATTTGTPRVLPRLVYPIAGRENT